VVRALGEKITQAQPNICSIYDSLLLFLLVNASSLDSAYPLLLHSQDKVITVAESYLGRNKNLSPRWLSRWLPWGSECQTFHTYVVALLAYFLPQNISSSMNLQTHRPALRRHCEKRKRISKNRGRCTRQRKSDSNEACNKGKDPYGLWERVADNVVQNYRYCESQRKPSP